MGDPQKVHKGTPAGDAMTAAQALDALQGSLEGKGTVEEFLEERRAAARNE